VTDGIVSICGVVLVSITGKRIQQKYRQTKASSPLWTIWMGFQRKATA